MICGYLIQMQAAFICLGGMLQNIADRIETLFSQDDADGRTAQQAYI
jgi:hypothetical protein